MQTESLLTITKKLLASYDLHAKKGLGQNFLIEGGILKKIAAAAELTPADTVIEVGPGLGVLTETLVEQTGKVIAVELDIHLADILKTRFTDVSKVTVINKDILKVNPADMMGKETVTKSSQIYPTTSPRLSFGISWKRRSNRI